MTNEDVLKLARWKTIPSFPDYEVSEYGDVRKGEKVLVSHVIWSGYVRVSLYVGGRTISKSVHQLVAEAFIGKRPEGMQVCHNDGVKSNNHYSNLRYATAKENEADKAKHGTKATGMRNGMNTHPDRRPSCDKHGFAKLTNAQVAEIKELLSDWKWGLGRALAKRFNVSEGTISRIRLGKGWLEA